VKRYLQLVYAIRGLYIPLSFKSQIKMRNIKPMSAELIIRTKPWHQQLGFIFFRWKTRICDQTHFPSKRIQTGFE